MYVSNELMEQQPQCLYTIKVSTDWEEKAGTDSRVTLYVFDQSGGQFLIQDLASYGVMGPYHNYFERSSVDFFQITNKCLDPCRLLVLTDGNDDAEWHLDYIDITVNGKSIYKRVNFPASVWIAQEYPYTLDVCLPLKKHTSHDNSSLT